MMKPVLLPWVCELTFMQQSVLLCSLRGPDGIRKDHPTKVLLRWLRRSTLYSAFEGREITTAEEAGGGSFTGPCKGNIYDYIEIYLRHVDELPHHFQLHLMHAAEIVGYKHPNPETARFWLRFYRAIVNDAHLIPEPESELDNRLSDSEAAWRLREEAPAL